MKLTDTHLAHFQREGYVVVENVLQGSDFEPLIHEYETTIDQRARELHTAGELSQLFKNEPFERRLACITEETTAIYESMDIMIFRGQALFEFLKHPKLMDVITGVLGPDILCSPIQHLRPKLPANLAYRGPLEGDARKEAEQRLTAFLGEHVAPWHQDAQVHLDDGDPSFILTVWIPMCDATTENGCMEIIPRVHKRGMVYWTEGFGISEDRLPDRDATRAIPMNKGSVLLMHKLIPHRSTPNHTNRVRWSMDLRYQKVGTSTGREHYPNFVAHSDSNPNAVLTDYERWTTDWIEALERVKKTGWPTRQYRPTDPAPMAIQEA